MARRKPKVDELRSNLLLVQALMNKYTKIGIFAVADAGMSTFMKRLREKFAGTNWHIYDGMENMGVQEPFVYSFMSDEYEYLPEFDVIYTLNYSQDYKESVTGVTFPDGLWRPIGEYSRVALYKHMGTLDSKLQSKYVKSMKSFKKLFRGEEVNEL
jgi:hypothetical protein